jgi:hypothetical protein
VVTQEQYERWHDFAIRMARICVKRKRNPNASEIESNVEHFFECLDPEDLNSIVDWDNSDPYPATSPLYDRTYKCPCWHCHGHKQPDCPYKCEDGHIYDYAEAMLVTDMCKEHEEAWDPNYWEDMSPSQAERSYEQWVSPVTCCIRAGLDMAVSPSAGVLGFTAGDLRRMYPEGVPDWVTGGSDNHWKHLDGTVNGTFAEMPNTTGVWL